jgi:hypothetical protein
MLFESKSMNILKNHSKGLNLVGTCGKCGTQKTFLLIEKQYLRGGKNARKGEKEWDQELGISCRSEYLPESGAPFM